MKTEIDKELLNNLIEEVNTFRTTMIPGFSYWKKGDYSVYEKEEGRLFQLYSGLLRTSLMDESISSGEITDLCFLFS